MPRDVARDALYSGQINLWVEDDLTRTFLSTLWSDPAVKFLIGGGHDGIGAILKDAEAADYKNVFGLVDRDFSRSNFLDWSVPGRSFRRFVLPRHEIENYLLDTQALQGCRYNTHKKTNFEIDAILAAEADRHCWWAACRIVVSRIRDKFFGQFMTHPTIPPVDTEAAAKAHITNAPWFRSLPRKAKGLTAGRIETLLFKAHARVVAMSRDGRWRQEFAGKEILRVIGNQIFNRSLAPRSYAPTAVQFEVDLAKVIAEWQVSNASIPSDLTLLLNALKQRVAAPRTDAETF